MRRRRGKAPQPPMPSDPMICRWCNGRRVLVQGQPYCQAGCTANDHAAYLEHCPECDRDYYTGLRRSDKCWECYEELMDQMRASYRPMIETRDYQRKEHARRVAESER